MSTKTWRTAVKSVAFFEFFFSLAVFGIIVVLVNGAVPSSRRHGAPSWEKQKVQKVINCTGNIFDYIQLCHDKVEPGDRWKWIVGLIASFFLLIGYISCSGKQFNAVNETEPVNKGKKVELLCTLVKLSLDTVSISMQFVIYQAYVVIGMIVIVRIVSVIVVVIYAIVAKDVKT